MCTLEGKCVSFQNRFPQQKLSIMKNIQIIDGALNCTYSVYTATEEEFSLLFPADGQDIQFAEDIDWDKSVKNAFENIWNRPIDKKKINGIHGTIFYELSYKKDFYPNKKESDIADFDVKKYLDKEH
jgi:hypothetical protein